MREWMKELTGTERDAVHEFEYLLDRKIENKVEFNKILSLLPKDAILNGYGRVEFFKTYPFMRKYRDRHVV